MPTLVIGTTTGSRRNLGREILPLPQFAAWLRRRKFAEKPPCFSVRKRPGFPTKT